MGSPEEMRRQFRPLLERPELYIWKVKLYVAEIDRLP